MSSPSAPSNSIHWIVVCRGRYRQTPLTPNLTAHHVTRLCLFLCTVPIQRFRGGFNDKNFNKPNFSQASQASISMLLFLNIYLFSTFIYFLASRISPRTGCMGPLNFPVNFPAESNSFRFLITLIKRVCPFFINIH